MITFRQKRNLKTIHAPIGHNKIKAFLSYDTIIMCVILFYFVVSNRRSYGKNKRICILFFFFIFKIKYSQYLTYTQVLLSHVVENVRHKENYRYIIYNCSK